MTEYVRLGMTWMGTRTRGATLTRRTIEQLRGVQTARALGHVHLIEFDERGFTIAHTDIERDFTGFDLETCSLHLWATDLGGPPEPIGTYIATPRAIGSWDLEPFADA